MVRCSFTSTLNALVLSAWIGVPWAVAVQAKEGAIFLPHGFVKGEDFIRMDANPRADYVMGLLDGMFAGTLFGASEPRVQALKRCNSERNNVQLAEVLYQYIKAHPEDWHYGAHLLFYNRMVELCPDIKP